MRQHVSSDLRLDDFSPMRRYYTPNMKGSQPEHCVSQNLRLRYSLHVRNVSLSLSHVHQLSKTLFRWVLSSPAGFRQESSKKRMVLDALQSIWRTRSADLSSPTRIASSRAQLSSMRASCRELSREPGVRSEID